LTKETTRYNNPRVFARGFTLLKHGAHGLGDFVEFGFSDNLARSVELGIQLYLNALEEEVTLDRAAGLEGKRILHIEMALGHGAVEIDERAEDISFDNGLLSHHYAGLGVDATFKSTINANVVGGSDITLKDGSRSNAVNLVDIYTVSHSTPVLSVIIRGCGGGFGLGGLCGGGLRLENIRLSHLLKLFLVKYTAVATELSVQIYLESLEAEISVNRATWLEGKRILYIEGTLGHCTAEVYISANDVSIHFGILTHHNAALGLDAALYLTVNTDVVGSGDFTFEHSALRKAAHVI
jgi:hypothetical protein